ncbi:MAG: MTH1187 family thiamine-binding protein [Proteobacteria bacterium]|nr:MTH1187 family thiamine-binding protein [Pseudomonadota bacterium]
MSVILEMSIFPMDKGMSVSPYVARALGIIRASGLEHRLGPMGTCIEGQWDEVMAVAGDCLRDLQQDCERVYLNMKLDWRRGGDGRLDAKPAAVLDKLGG